jgi:hypothetical protein
MMKGSGNEGKVQRYGAASILEKIRDYSFGLSISRIKKWLFEELCP